VTSPVGKDKVIEIVVGEHHLKAITPVDYDKVKEAIETEKKAIDLELDNKEFKENLALYGRENKKR